MEKRTKTTAMVLAGSVALASTAYGIGSQSGDGTTDAATRSAKAAAGGQTLAERLGVSEAKLRAAFEDIRKDDPPPGGDPRARLEKALADALGRPQTEIADALDQLRKQHEAEHAERRAAFAKSLADELGIDASKVTAALDKLRPERARMRRFRGGPPPGGPGFGPPPGASEKAVPPPGGRGFDGPAPGGPGMGGPPPGGPGFDGPPPGASEKALPPPGANGARRMRLAPPPGRDRLLSALAKELGVERSDLRAALRKVGPKRPKTDPRTGFAADLAKALGADEADVQSALDGLRKDAEAKMKARRDEFAAKLAERLDLPVEKVKDALAAGPPGPPHGGVRFRMAPPPGAPGAPDAP
jgi:transcriptional regulator with XRE-family HTH domain